MSIDFETQVLARLGAIEEQVASLGRAVRGAPAEGNIGLQAQIADLRTRAERSHDAIERRLIRVERLEIRLRAWVTTASAIGAAVGATLAIVLDLRRWFGA